MVEEAAGGGHEQVDAALQLLGLGGAVRAAHDLGKKYHSCTNWSHK